MGFSFSLLVPHLLPPPSSLPTPSVSFVRNSSPSFSSNPYATYFFVLPFVLRLKKKSIKVKYKNHERWIFFFPPPPEGGGKKKQK